jgi:hypothetical protein
MSSPSIRPPWKLIWMSWAPPRVKYFLYLACQDCSWVSDRLVVEDSTPTKLVMVSATRPKRWWSISSLVCSYSQITWNHVLSLIGSSAHMLTGGENFKEWWQLDVLSAPMTSHKGVSSMIMLTWLLKWRNTIIFDSTLPHPTGLIDTIKTEARSCLVVFYFHRPSL